ncbi:MAG: succinate dehydrogenase, cytochrome b556 subunit [Gammaproteobacteria bacterium]|nr:succinate dehydrogenase, cytochrome b556 subunit [Gammaproteobacteria bacterium]
MSNIDRPLSPHLQVYRWQITMTLSILHRATGVALAAGLLLLIGWLVAAATGPESYTQVRDLLSSLPGVLILVAFAWAFSYHLCNGIRHLFWDAGIGFEKTQYRASGWAVVIASAAITAVLVAIAMGVASGSAA